MAFTCIKSLIVDAPIETGNSEDNIVLYGAVYDNVTIHHMKTEIWV